MAQVDAGDCAAACLVDGSEKGFALMRGEGEAAGFDCGLKLHQGEASVKW